MQRFSLLFIATFILGYSGLSQQINITWKPVSKNQLLSKSMTADQDVPLEHIYNVDFNALNQQLLNFDINLEGSILFELPLPNGLTETFKLFNSSIMEAGLQANNPNIRTFMLRSVKDGSITGRVGISPEGFYGIIEVDGREVLINKISSNDNNHYSFFDLAESLRGSDKITAQICGTDMDIADHKIAAPAVGEGLEERSEEIRMRHFRVGIAVTSSFSKDVGANATSEQVLAKVVSVINNVNLRYNKDHGMQLDLIDKTPTLFNLEVATDYFNIQTNSGQLLGPSQEFFNSKLLSTEYDFGQTWTTTCLDAGGVVSGSACNNGSKARGVSCGPNNVGYFLSTVKHEMGHQFSASHTFNSCNGSTQLATEGAYEPGSGSTIMSYGGGCGPDNIGNGKDDYFHIISILQVRGHHVAYPNCGTFGTEINHTPDPVLPGYHPSLLTIPMDTPYELIGTATDPDNDALLYNWEQFDAGSGEPLGTNFASGPLNRSYPPSAKGNIRMIPRLNSLINDVFDIADRLPLATREMNWKFVVRDYNINAGGVSTADFKFLVDSNAGPFKFTFPAKTTDTIFAVGQYVELHWDVANSDKATVNSKFVDIFYSTDGGTNFTDTLVLATPNDGSEYVMIPAKAVNARFKIKGTKSIFLDISRRALRANEPLEPGYSYDVYPHNALLCPADPKTFIIKGITWKDFNSPVKVELVDGWPLNAIVTLNKTDLVPGEDIILTIDTKNVNEAGFFTIRIRAVSAGMDTLWRFIMIEVLPASLQFTGAINPVPGTVNVPQVPSFAWSPIPGADIYQFELSSDPKFSNIVDSYSGTNTFFNTVLVLAPGTIFYWRVRATNRCYDGPWSTLNTFQTILYECNTISALGLPKAISSNINTPPVEIKFDISNKVGIVADINVKNINIAHGDISKLEISAKAPSGKTVVLMSERCAGISGMSTSFDDSSPLAINCGQIKANRTFQPGEPLSGFIGEQVQGDWSVLITSKKGGSSGNINTLDFELCASVSSSPIVKINNNLFKVKTGFPQVLENKDLKYESDQTTEDKLTYVLISEPKHGYFTVYGQRIDVGGTFVQAFLNDWAVYYVPFDNIYEGPDKAIFVVKDDKFGYRAPETLHIDINDANILSTTPPVKDISDLIRIYPNPTKDQITIDMTYFKWSGSGRLNIVDISGRNVITKTLVKGATSINLDMGQLPSGIYFAKIVSGNYVAKQKLIKI